MRKFKFVLQKIIEFLYTGAEHRIGPYAAQASFFIILSIVPFCMFLLSVLHIALPYFVKISDADVIASLNSMFPYRMALFLEDIVYDIFYRSSGISVVTAAMAIWFSSRGLMAVNQGVNNVLSDGELQNYFVCRVMSVIYVIIFEALIAVTIALFGFGSELAQKLSGMLPDYMDTVYKIFQSRSLIMFVLLTFFFTLFYKFMPKRKWKIRELIPGAALAAAGWVLFTKVFEIYVASSKSYASVYGGMSYIIFGMLWLYFCLNIMLLGAEFNRSLKLGLFTKKS